MSRYLCLLAALFAMSLEAPAADLIDWRELDRDFERGVLIISTSDTGCYRFDVHLAISGPQQRRGLMFVRSLPEWAGMLFPYRNPDYRSMWMKNTYVPLDILFARADGVVSSVVENTEPLSLTSISSVEPVTYVLELSAGTAARLGIGPGSRLVLDGTD